MKCPKCQFDNPDSMQFCGKCGSKLANVCPECEFVNPPGFGFCGKCGAKLGEPSTAQSGVSTPKLEDMHTQLQSLIPDELARKYMSAEQQATGENRPITALFADISGFTPLSNTQSSETMFQLVQDCFRELVGIVARYEGSISGFRGDGLLALFGAPILHENDAERAILAAVDMRSVMNDKQLQVSIGINTAMMTVGDIQTQLHSEYTAYGTDVNLAKRLQEAAEPGQILVGTGTHRLTRRMFDFDVMESLSVKGFDRTVTAYSVQQVKERPEKLRGIEGLRARMIGREHEFADLKEAADQWLAGQGQMVSIIGEAGIGKSRLVSELKEYLASGIQHPASSILEGRCVSIGQPISYWPFLDILRAHFALGEDDDTPTRARKVTESITQLMPQAEDEALPLLGNLLSIKFGNKLDDRLKFAGPEQIRHQTLMRLRDIFRTLAEQKPLLLILEDLHWADDLSLDLISLLMDELANTPLMLLCVYRPEKEHRVWQLGDQARRKCLDRYTELTLHPLSSHQSRLLVESLLEIENLPDSTKDTILTKSEGNPFFIEEVIRSLIEQDMIYHQDDHWKARDEIAAIHVPDTIQSVVLARVDRLASEAKYVLQCASVIGRLFRHRLLKHISQQERNLDRHISEFESKELIYEERTVPELEYAFKHAFTQETTYEGILKQRRKEFHQQVAEGIERLYQERIDEYYEELAHHYSRSGDAEKAVEYLLKAGNKARQSYDNEAAISYFQSALDTMERHGIQRDNWRMEALLELGKVYLRVSDFAAENVLKEATELAKHMKLAPRQLVLLYAYLSSALFVQGRHNEGIRYAEIGLDGLGDDTRCMEAAIIYARIAAGYGFQGSCDKYWEYTQKHMSFIKDLPYSAELQICYVHIIQNTLWHESPDAAWHWSEELEERATQNHDLRALSLAYWGKGRILRSKGDYKNALSFQQRSLDNVRRIGDILRVAKMHNWIAGTLLCLGKIEEAKANAHVGMDMSVLAGFPRSILFAYARLGDIAVSQKKWEQAISHYQKGLAEGQCIGRLDLIAYALLPLGKTYLGRGDYQSSLNSLQDAVYRAIAAPDDSDVLPPKIVFIAHTLGRMEEGYKALGTPEEFLIFCRSLVERYAGVMESLLSLQPFLVPMQPSEVFCHPVFADNFEGKVTAPSWKWMDESSDCACSFIEAEGLEICAANGQDLYRWNLSAPSLMMDVSGDFAAEVCVSKASEEEPQIGGLLIWIDKNNFLRFERGVDGQQEMRLQGCVNGEWQVAGRGMLFTSEDQQVHLRLERSGDEFTSYCSIDRKNWFTCGTMTLPMEDPIQVGIHAIGMIDRTIYCGAYKEGTATVFRNFRIWTRD